MCLYMYIYIYRFIYKYVYIYMYVYIYIHICKYINIHVYIYVCIHIFIHINVSTYVCLFRVSPQTAAVGHCVGTGTVVEHWGPRATRRHCTCAIRPSRGRVWETIASAWRMHTQGMSQSLSLVFS